MSLTIDILLNVDGDFDGHDVSDVTCKQTFRKSETLLAFIDKYGVPISQ